MKSSLENFNETLVFEELLEFSFWLIFIFWCDCFYANQRLDKLKWYQNLKKAAITIRKQFLVQNEKQTKLIVENILLAKKNW